MASRFWDQPASGCSSDRSFEKSRLNTRSRSPFQTNNVFPRRTGFVYDKFTEKHSCLWDPLHAEKPARATRIIERLNRAPDALVAQCETIESRFATDDEIRLVHTQELIDDVKRTCDGDAGSNDSNLKEFSARFDDVYINKDSERCAALAAGCTLELVDAVMSGKVDNGMAIVRPPGHHASGPASNGFCVYNNVAIAAKHLLENCGVTRILIVDFDVHHGQGTQRIFYRDDRVLYFSIHMYEDGVKWPHLRESNFDYVGAGAGWGYNINVPLNKSGLDDAEYLAIFHQILLPVAFEYAPEVVLVSAGYDAAIGCPEGHMRVTPAMYGHMTSALCNLAGGRVAVVLEGGYCLDSLSEGVACTLEALLGRSSYPLPSMGKVDETAVTSILNAISVLRKYWRSLRYQAGSEQHEHRKTRSRSNEPALRRHTPVLRFAPPPDVETSENSAYGCTPFYTCSETVDLRYEIRELANSYALFRSQMVCSVTTGYVYDDIMTGHTAGRTDAGPEIPQRIVAIFEHLTEVGLLNHCIAVPSRAVTEEELSLIHEPEYVETLMLPPAKFDQECRRRTDSNNHMPDAWPGDIFATEETQPAMLTAAGSLLNVVDAVLDKTIRNGFAIVRPPGHHAHGDHPAGFCFANNVAIAAKHAIVRRGLKRILIVDWDVHHGDGVQDTFYEDPRVLYISLHRGTEDFYPQGRKKFAAVVGGGAGEGYNVNIPWNSGGVPDGAYLSAFTNLILPLAYEFAPDLVLVSCGFDAALGDPLGGCAVSPVGFSIMTRMLMNLAGGKLVLALEGGYNLQALRTSSEAVVRALMGFPVENVDHPLFPPPAAVKDIGVAIDAQNGPHSPWKSLSYRVVFEEVVDTTAQRQTPSADGLAVSDLETSLSSMNIQA